MPDKTTMTRIDKSTLALLRKVAHEDRRTLITVLALAVEEYAAKKKERK